MYIRETWIPMKDASIIDKKHRESPLYKHCHLLKFRQSNVEKILRVTLIYTLPSLKVQAIHFNE